MEASVGAFPNEIGTCSLICIEVCCQDERIIFCLEGADRFQLKIIQQ